MFKETHQLTPDNAEGLPLTPLHHQTGA